MRTLTESNYKKARRLFGKLNDSFFALIALQVVLAITAYFVRANNYLPFRHWGKTYYYWLMLINASAVAVAKGFQRAAAGKAKTFLEFPDALNHLMKRKIAIYVALFLANVANVAVFLFTNNYFSVALFVIILLLFFAYKPLEKEFLSAAGG